MPVVCGVDFSILADCAVQSQSWRQERVPRVLSGSLAGHACWTNRLPQVTHNWAAAGLTPVTTSVEAHNAGIGHPLVVVVVVVVVIVTGASICIETLDQIPTSTASWRGQPSQASATLSARYADIETQRMLPRVVLQWLSNTELSLQLCMYYIISSSISTFLCISQNQQ